MALWAVVSVMESDFTLGRISTVERGGMDLCRALGPGCPLAVVGCVAQGYDACCLCIMLLMIMEIPCSSRILILPAADLR